MSSAAKIEIGTTQLEQSRQRHQEHERAHLCDIDSIQAEKSCT